MLKSHLELSSTTNRERLKHPSQKAQEQSGPTEEEARVGHLFQFLFFPTQRRLPRKYDNPAAGKTWEHE